MIYDAEILVVGAGHAGCEAALAAARMGKTVMLITPSMHTIAKMSCNPAIGGTAKGHLVREIDALGGEMGLASDETGIQFKMLNRKKGPAVWSPRAQADREKYSDRMKRALRAESRISINVAWANGILTEDGKIRGIRLSSGEEVLGKRTILATGTFMNGLIHIGMRSFQGGRLGESAAEEISKSLSEHGFQLGRLKTGTPPRIDGNTVSRPVFQELKGDERPQPFSFRTERIERRQATCLGTKTNEKTSRIIRQNLNRSPLYSGKIKGIGPRYCPSIEVKVVRFPQMRAHSIILEPEGLETAELYVNGASTSLPEDVQEAFLHSIEGLETCRITSYGYAIEYDYVFPTQLKETLETNRIKGLFLAGQINGTSGYEEAASQGLMAGINASLSLDRTPPIVLKRSEAYIGVLIDDLVTRGTEEPYRMFTSRAEYRLLLRQDNADRRLMSYGKHLGLIPDDLFQRRKKHWDESAREESSLKKEKYRGKTLAHYLRRPEKSYEEVMCMANRKSRVSPEAARDAEISIKYEGYIKRQLSTVERFAKIEEIRIPEEFDFRKITGLKKEASEKLDAVRPGSVGQASRISGVTPSDIALLMIALKR